VLEKAWFLCLNRLFPESWVFLFFFLPWVLNTQLNLMINGLSGWCALFQSLRTQETTPEECPSTRVGKAPNNPAVPQVVLVKIVPEIPFWQCKTVRAGRNLWQEVDRDGAP